MVEPIVSPEWDELRQQILQWIAQDDSGVRAAFCQRFQNHIQEFARHTATALIDWRTVESDAKDEERSYVAALVLIALRLHVQSMTLFVAGHQIAAGNLSRQVVESIALGLLCSRRSYGILQRFMEGKYSTHKALDDLAKTKTIKELNLNRDGIASLQQARRYYDNYSHPTRITIAESISFSGAGIYLGLAFDPEKVPIYEREMERRVSLAKILPNFIVAVRAQLSRW